MLRGIVWRWVVSERGLSVTTRATTAWAVEPVNGGSPESISYSTAAQGVDVRAGGDLALAHRLLGAHVVRRAERHAGLGHPAPAGLAGRERDAEVGDQGLAVVQQDVLGLDVAVDHAVAVGVVERARRPRW